MKYLFVLLLMFFWGMECYSQWTEITPYGGGVTDGAFSFVINGKAYVGGGPGSKAFYQFDPGTGKWTKMADVGGGARGWAFAFSINGIGYVGGGDPTGQFTTFLNDVWQYDPTTNKWSQKTNFPGTARDAAFTFVVNGKAFMGGGYNNPNTLYDFWQYDPQSDTWTSLGYYTGGQNVFAATFVINNVPYVCGGGLNSCYSYNADVNTWSKKANFPGTLRESSIGFAINGKGYVGMGETGDFSTAFQDFFEYDPINDSWTKRADLTYPIANSAWSTGFTIGDTIYAGTGVSLPAFSYTNRFFQMNMGAAAKSSIINIRNTMLTFYLVNVGESLTQPVTIINQGDTDLFVSGITVTDANSVFTLDNFQGTLTIKPNDSANVMVKFTPKTAKLYSAKITINSNSSNASTMTVNLSGSGIIKKPQINLNMQEMNFGKVKLTKAKDSIFTITNKGDTTLIISYFTIVGDTANVFSYDLIGILNIEPDSSMSYDIKFVPKNATHYTAKLIISSNDSANSQMAINLSGDGESGQSVGEEQDILDVLNIIPNPVTSNSVIIINMPAPSNIDLDIYNLSGIKNQNIFSGNFFPEGMQTYNLNTDNLPCGIYFLQLKTEGRFFSKKFILQ